MKKNFVLLTEGTGQGVPEDRSNVSILADALVKDRRQFVHLETGPGTHWGMLVGGRVSGTDAINILVAHYAALARALRPARIKAGDYRIFLFGFSRGALIARALAELLCGCGVPSDPDDARRILKYHRAGLAEELADLHVAGRLNYLEGVRYLGVWDTVDATVGIAGEQLVRTPEQVREARHAVAIDEHRKFFDYLPMRGEHVAERYFPGSHQDVGGGYTDNHVLSDVTLAWVANPAVRAGMRLKPGVKFSMRFDPRTAVIHDSLKMASNAYGLLEPIERKLSTNN